jgi:hypothetical protein
MADVRDPEMMEDSELRPGLVAAQQTRELAIAVDDADELPYLEARIRRYEDEIVRRGL